MAESGEIESRSREELRHIKAVSSVPARRPPQGHKKRTHHGPIRVLPKRSANRAFFLQVTAPEYGECCYAHGAISILMVVYLPDLAASDGEIHQTISP
jgi:hypothetical protein